MKRQVTIGILITISFTIFGQRIDSLTKLLQERNFKKVENYLTKTDSIDKKIKYYKRVNRQIISSFDEYVLIYEETIPVKGKDYFAEIKSHRIKLLTFENKIIFCRLDYLIMQSFDKEKTAKKELKYSDKDLLNNLKKEYYNLYKRKISLSDFFTEKVIYGEECGWTSENPKYRDKLNELIKAKKIKRLDSWLSSPITEMQIYAIDGFYQLKNTGYKLTTKELELIEIIKNKRGEIRTCLADLRLNRPITKITEEFKF